MQNNPIKVYTRNFLITKIQERDREPFSVAETLLYLFLPFVGGPQFLTGMLLLMLSDKYPVIIETHMGLIGMVVLAIISLSVIVRIVMRSHKRWKTEGSVLESRLNDISGDQLKVDPTLIKVYHDVTVGQNRLIEQDGVPLCSLDIRLDTGDTLENIIAVRSPVFVHMSEFDVSEYPLEEVHIYEGQLVQYKESTVLEEERITQERLVR